MKTKKFLRLCFLLLLGLTGAKGYSQCANPTVSIDTIVTRPLCYGTSTASIQVNITGGLAPYTYSLYSDTIPDQTISLNSNTYTFTNLPPGTYLIATQVTLPVGFTFCTKGPIIINSPPAITITPTITDVACNGGNTGAIDIAIAGGTPPYSNFSWNTTSPSNTEDISNLAAGSYTVTFTDGNGCPGTGTFNVSEPSALTITPDIDHVTCSGANDGAIDLSVSGGTAPYTYSWVSPVSNASSISGLAGGSYTVTVTDDNGCEETISYTVNEPAALSLSALIGDATCPGLSDGTIDLTVNGGTSPYTYAWNTGASSQDLSGLPSGAYTVTVRDANGCEETSVFNVSEPAPLVITPAITDVSCPGGSDGAISIIVTDGVPPYSYSWDITPDPASTNVSGLSSGSYTVTVTDANLCKRDATFTVNEPPAITISGNPIDATCLGVNDGSIDITVNGGTPNYTYSWSPGGASSQDISGLAGGSYTVTVTDNNGCEETATFSIIQPPALTLTETITHVDCNGNGNGAIDLEVSGGTGPYDYSWNTLPAPTLSQDLSGLNGGSYTVTVTDNNGCSQNATYNINEPSPITLSENITDVTCNGGSDGAITLIISGGTAPYSNFQWNGNPGSQNISGVGAGSYTVTFNDANGCPGTATYSISEPAPIVITPTITDVTCNGGNNGAISVVISGGTAPYNNIQWNGTASPQNISNLTAGSYTITFTDGAGCPGSATFNVAEPAAFVITPTISDISCNGTNNGSISIAISGGIAPYNNFQWNGTPSTQNISGLTAGSYTVTFTDANGCPGTATYSISEPTSIVITPTVTDVTCNGGNDGAISLAISGGVTPYSNFEWNGSPSTQNISGLTAGSYTVTFTDANGCPGTATYSISEPTPIVITPTVTDVTCNGGNDGAISLAISGGVTPYSNFEWNGSPSTQNISGLTAGSYTVTFTDANGCPGTATYSVSEPAPIVITPSITDVTCNGGNNGAISVVISGGTAPYSNLQWNGTPSTQNISGLTAGSYTITFTDGTGCPGSATFNVNEPAGMTIASNITNALCGGMNDGAIDIEVNGGLPAYSYVWSPGGETTQDLTNIGNGSYSVTVTDQNGCNQNATFDVTVTLTFDLTIIISTPQCNGDNNGIIDVSMVSGGTAPYTYSFNGGPFGATNVFNNLTAGNYALSVRDASGCQQDSLITLTEPAVLDLIATFDSPICSYGNNGEVTLSGNGGTPVYLFSDNGVAHSSQNVYSGLNPGTYRYYIMDGNGCRDSVDATLAAHPQVNIGVINANITNLTCSGVNSGRISLTNITGGTPPYTFTLNGGIPQTDSTFIGLPAANHTIEIIDVFGCRNPYNFTITSPPPIDFNLTVIQEETCTNADGIFRLSNMSGGVSPYTYRFNGGAPVAYAGQVDFTNLSSQAYTITVTDNSTPQCSQTKSIVLPKKPGPVPFIKLQDVTCPGGSDGMVIIDSLEGGVANFNIRLEDTLGYSQTLTNVGRNDSVAFAGLLPHLYGMTITDQECTYTTNLFYIYDADSLKYDTVFVDSLLITEPAPIGDSIYTYNTDRRNNTGYAIIYGFHGGTPGYYFSLDNINFQPVANDSVIVKNLDVGEYIMYIRDRNGCPHIDTFTIGVDLFIPNLISPNGDNHNDVFEIIALPPKSELRIFNRWGSRVYFSEDYDNLWSGNNEPDGVYYFELLLPSNKLYKGWVEIIR